MRPENGLEVLDPGALTLVQDAGRPGMAHLGVPRAGAADAGSAAAANRLVGNAPSAAVLESLLGGLVVRLAVDGWVAVTGAVVAVRVGERPVAWGEPVRVRAGEVLALGTPTRGLRTYLAVAGGIEPAPVLGSRSTDTLAWIGPPRLAAGVVVPIGRAAGTPRAGTARPPVVSTVLRVHPGPHTDWFPEGLSGLGGDYAVSVDSDRVGLRLIGPAVRRREGELASEGIVLGAVQVPPDGAPVVFLADHPTTGGYPVVGVVDAADLDGCAQLRPGDVVRFTPARADDATR